MTSEKPRRNLGEQGSLIELSDNQDPDSNGVWIREVRGVNPHPQETELVPATHDDDGGKGGEFWRISCPPANGEGITSHCITDG